MGNHTSGSGLAFASFHASSAISHLVFCPGCLSRGASFINACLIRPISLKIRGMLLRHRSRALSKPVHKRLYVLRNVEKWMKAPEKDLYQHWATAFNMEVPADGKKKSKLD